MTFFRSNSRKIFIDNEDAAKIISYKWRLRWDGRIDGKINGKRMLLHRFLMNPKPDQQIDHIDGNPLNNQKSNLRFCNNSQNQQNSVKKSGCKIPYKGVSKKGNLYSLHVGGRLIRSFENLKDAAIGYDIVAKQLYGNFFRGNFQNGISKNELIRVENLLRFKKQGLSYFTSKYKGIGFHIGSRKWRARVKIGKNNYKSIGYFKTEQEAIIALNNFHES